MSFYRVETIANLVSDYCLTIHHPPVFATLFHSFPMKAAYSFRQDFSHSSSSSVDYTSLAAGRDFTTLDGRLVPRALGEAALRQRTALLVGGLLIGEWPDHL